MVLAFLAGMTFPAASQPILIGYKANVVEDMVVCRSAEALINMLEAGMAGKQAEAAKMLRQSVAKNECRNLTLFVFKPVEVMKQWDDDGTGAPGAVVRGWLMGPNNTQLMILHVWMNPKALTEYFGVAGDET